MKTIVLIHGPWMIPRSLPLLYKERGVVWVDASSEGVSAAAGKKTAQFHRGEYNKKGDLK